MGKKKSWMPFTLKSLNFIKRPGASPPLLSASTSTPPKKKKEKNDKTKPLMISEKPRVAVIQT